MHELFDSTVQILINFINEIGYLGIFIGMFLESTLVPIPSELVMIPVGISAATGQSELNIYIATAVGIAGNIAGAIFSYCLAEMLGRKILLKIGKYFFVKEKTIIKIEDFFKEHGAISVFIARMLPGFRHFISLPAGLARMNFTKFTFYTTAGSTIWTIVLVSLGFIIGDNQELIGHYLHLIIKISIAVAMALTAYFIWKQKRKISS
jgi:membrane protein DedA with SNARE-associated domain